MRHKWNISLHLHYELVTFKLQINAIIMWVAIVVFANICEHVNATNKFLIDVVVFLAYVLMHYEQYLNMMLLQQMDLNCHLN